MGKDEAHFTGAMSNEYWTGGEVKSCLNTYVCIAESLCYLGLLWDSQSAEYKLTAASAFFFTFSTALIQPCHHIPNPMILNFFKSVNFSPQKKKKKFNSNRGMQKVRTGVREQSCAELY